MENFHQHKIIVSRKQIRKIKAFQLIKIESEIVSCSVMSDSANLWTIACQALLSMEFSRQEYWSGLPFSSPGDLLDPGIKHGSPTLQADSLLSEPPGKPFEGLVALKGYKLENNTSIFYSLIHSSINLSRMSWAFTKWGMVLCAGEQPWVKQTRSLKKWNLHSKEGGEMLNICKQMEEY